MSDIFVSYARKDADAARLLVEDLQAEGRWSAWWDPEIAPGRAFDREIEHQLATAGCVIVLWSRHSVASDWVRAEATAGLNRKVLIPVVIDPEIEPPLAFRHIQTIRLPSSRCEAREAAVRTLSNAVAERLGALQPETVRDSQQAPKYVGPYRLRRLLGEGGMGEVWEAEQQSPMRRVVAIKLVKLGMDTKQVVARFESERQALAVMDHPNIARVFDAGATETGRPYFAMELANGLSINRFCDQYRLTVPERLGLFVTVCEAVQHAHQKGVIHRDLKPSNILVTFVDETAAPKIIDFGIAKATGYSLTDKTLVTTEQQMIGTPEYMSPEQADLSIDIDTRADVYSLGAILYELLIGQLPFDPERLRQTTLSERQRIIREEEPQRPSARFSSSPDQTEIAELRRTNPGALRRRLGRDLDWIVMRALEKDRRRRYDTANALAADLRRYLADKPVEARPPSASDRMIKFARRHRAGVTIGAVFSVALLLGTIGTSIGLLRAQQEARRGNSLKSLVIEMIGELNPAGVPIPDILPEGHDAVAWEVFSPREAAALEELVGTFFYNSAKYKRAEPHLRHALDLYQTDAEPESEAALRTLNQLAMTHFNQEQPGQAEPLLDQLCSAYTRLYGPRDERTLTCVHNLVAVYLQQERYEKAEPLLRQLLEDRREVLGREHLQVAATLNNLGQLLRMTGRLPEAEPVYVEALRIREAKLDGPRILISLFNLGDLYSAMGRLVQAEPLLRRALKGFEELYADKTHPYTLEAEDALARVLLGLGRIEEAKRVARQCYEGRLERFGRAHAKTRSAEELLAQLGERFASADR